MAAGADYLSERAETPKINPLAPPEAAGHLCQDRVYDRGRAGLGEKELLGDRLGKLALVHGYAGAVSGAMRIRRPFALPRGVLVRGDPLQDGLGDLPEVGGVVFDNRGCGLVPGEVGLF